MNRSAAVLVLAIVIAACAQDQDVAQPAMPAAIETATPEPTAETTPVPTPEPTSVVEPTPTSTPDSIATVICPNSREKPGHEFTYNRNTMNRFEAIDANCGKAQEPSVDIQESSVWVSGINMAGAPHIYTDTIFHDYPSVFSTKLELLCFNDYFYITVDVGSPEIFPTTGLFVDVLYAFSGDDITAVNFDKLNYQQSQWLVERQTNEVAVMPPGDKERNLFLTDIRNHTAFYISIANPDGGVNTMYFDITGAEDSIDPVLAACNVS